MATTRIYISLLLLAFCASLVIPSSCYGYSRRQNKHTALFIFGDSLFDAGNNNYINTTTNFQANWWPYGETFFKYPTGRFSNGRIIPDIIAEYANLPLIPPYLQPGFNNYTYGANFASGGAGALAETYQGFVIDLKTQLGYFKKVEKQLRHKLGDEESHTLLSNAVYLISIGTNDYGLATVANSSLFKSQSHEEYVGMVIGNLTNVIKEIYKKGGRKFGLPNGFPLGCSPSRRAFKPGNTGTCVEEPNDIVKLHTVELDKILLDLKEGHQGFKYSNPSFYSYLIGLIDKPSKYGFKEGKEACCGSGPYRGISSCGGKRAVKDYQLCENVTEYVFFDSGHPTERVYEQISKLWWMNHSHSDSGPYFNLKDLFEA